MAAGVAPELRAQPKPSTTVLTANAIPAVLEAPPSLPLGAVNALYMQALADPDVALLISSLGESARLDPPDRSHDLTFDAVNRSQSVMLPIVSYTSGAKLAYLCFGTATAANPSGAPLSMPMRGMVTASGAITIAGGGRLAPNPRAENNDIIFASLFPREYYQTRVLEASTAPATGPIRRTSDSGWDPRGLRFAAAAPDKRADCIDKCNTAWQSCLNVPLVSTCSGAVVGFWCATCLGLATGASIITLGAAAPALSACLTPCAISAAALAAAVLTLKNCESVARRCLAACRFIPPGLPIA